VGLRLNAMTQTDASATALHVCAFAYKFTGKERDAESGLDYFGARYFASNMGRYMSPDWSAQEEPVPYAKLTDPQSLNLYSYVLNNPLTRRDPDGHAACINDVDNGHAQSCAPDGTYLGPEVESPADPNSPEVGKKGKAQQQYDTSQNTQNTSQSATSTSPQDNMAFAKGGGGQRKGERNHAAKPDGTPDPAKHTRPDPNKPGNILVKDPHTGKTVSKPNPNPTVMDRMTSITPRPILKMGTAGVIVYIIIDEGSRLYPPRNLVPVP
jgi:RHS repeat-associated protein